MFSFVRRTRKRKIRCEFATAPMMSDRQLILNSFLSVSVPFGKWSIRVPTCSLKFRS